LAREIKAIIVDTYAIMADLTGQATSTAIKTLDLIRTGRTEGLIHYLIVYELAYHWRKRRLPFHDEEELFEFVNTYFSVVNLSPEIAVEASRVKVIGDRLLQSTDERFKRRKLSIADATTIALAIRLKAPIVTGDVDLTYVARRMGVKVVW